jgi:hypothetical protein
MKKLIKLSETHYIVVENSIIKVGDWYLDKNGEPRLCEDGYHEIALLEIGSESINSYKVIRSTRPLEGVEFIHISEVQEVLDGYNIGKLAELHTLKMFEDYKSSDKNSFIEGFNACKELMKEKRFTRRDMVGAFVGGTNVGSAYESMIQDGDYKNAEFFAEEEEKEFQDSLNEPTEWEVIIEEGKLKLI